MRESCAVVEAAYSIAGVVERPVEPASILRALEPLQVETLEETLHGEALRRRGWLSLVEAITTAREALREALGERAALEHRGGSTWEAIVPGIETEEELGRLLEVTRDVLGERAPSEHVVVVGTVGSPARLREASSRATARLRELLDPDAGDDRVDVVRAAA